MTKIVQVRIGLPVWVKVYGIAYTPGIVTHLGPTHVLVRLLDVMPHTEVRIQARELAPREETQ